MGAFTESIMLYVDQMVQEDLPNHARRVGLAVLQDIVTRSPVGDPKRWKINRAFALSLQHTSAVNAAQRRKNGGRLKPGQKKKASALVEFKTKAGQTVRFRQRGWAARNYTGGRFRGNWQITFNRPAVGTVDRIDKAGTATMQAGGAVLETYDVTSVSSIWFTNNLPYAQRLENGWSGQAPRGILRITAARYIGGGI